MENLIGGLKARSISGRSDFWIMHPPFGQEPLPLLAEHPLTRGVPAEHIDAGLAAICGYMMAARQRPVPPTSPWIRVHSNWWAEASWAWLAARRGWS